MNELELLYQLQTIKHKLDNNQGLNDHEYKLLAYVLFIVIMDVAKWSFNIVSKIIEGDDDE